MLILLKTPLETLNYFIDSMAKGHPDATVMDITDPDFFSKATELLPHMDTQTTVLLFNGAGRAFEFSDGRNVWESKGVRLFNFLVDHPVNYIEYLRAPLVGETVLVIDRSHKAFVERYHPDVRVFFMPHGGTKGHTAIPYEEREIPVIYLGSCQERVADFPALPYLSESGKFYEFIIRRMIGDYSLSAQAAVEMFLDHEGIALPQDKEADMILAAHCNVERICRRKQKLETIHRLAQGGIPVEIYGVHWEEVAAIFPDLIRLHERVSSDECVRLTGNAKIALNLSTYLKDGSHERVYIAMLNKALCVTERSRYLEEKFTDGKDIIFFDYERLDLLCDKIKHLLSHPREADEIIQNAYARVARSTWGDRLNDIIHGPYDPPTTP